MTKRMVVEEHKKLKQHTLEIDCAQIWTLKDGDPISRSLLGLIVEWVNPFDAGIKHLVLI